MFSSSTVNSSPPSRASSAAPRVAVRSRSAMCCSTRSPKLWPRVSLIDLKLSRSTNSSARRCSLPARVSAPVRCADSVRRLGSWVSGSWCARWCSWRVRSATWRSSSAWWARSSASACSMRSAMVLKESASSAISREPPRGARALRSPAARRRVAAVRRRTGTLMLSVSSSETSSSRPSTVAAESRSVLLGVLGGNRPRAARRAPGRGAPAAAAAPGWPR